MYLKIKNLVELQNQLNIETNGDKWIEGFTNKGKEINWYTCMLLEASEAIDSTPWKHWKAIEGTSDIQNIHIELVDIAHFLISESIALNKGNLLEVSDTLYFFFKGFKIEEEQEFDFKLFNKETKYFQKICLDLDFQEGERTFSELIGKFIELLSIAGLSFEELYKLYIMKNALNRIRQSNGYKEGTYMKIWEEQEDNVFISELVSSNPELAFVEIMEILQTKYDSLS